MQENHSLKKTKLFIKYLGVLPYPVATWFIKAFLDDGYQLQNLHLLNVTIIDRVFGGSLKDL